MMQDICRILWIKKKKPLNVKFKTFCQYDGTGMFMNIFIRLDMIEMRLMIKILHVFQFCLNNFIGMLVYIHL